MLFLIIDDDKSVCDVLQRKFAAYENVKVLRTNHLEGAMDAINQCGPDVLFMDHHLTHDGGEGLKMAQFLYETEDPITMYSISGYLGPELEALYRGLGVRYVGKDIDKISEAILWEEQQRDAPV